MQSTLSKETKSRIYAKLQELAQAQSDKEFAAIWDKLPQAEKRKRVARQLSGKPNKPLYQPSDTVLTFIKHSETILRDDLTFEQEAEIKTHKLQYELHNNI